MKYGQIKQFKLTSNEEIVCEVMEWDSEDNPNIIIRAALRIVQGEDVNNGFRFFSFSPWMGFMEDPYDLVTLNAGHIIGESNPGDSLLDHYGSAIQKLLQEGISRRDFDLAEFEGMDEEQIANYIESKLDEDDAKRASQEPDADGNVVPFKPRVFH